MHFLKQPIFRSEALRRAAAELECVACGRFGYTQAAHLNEGKGKAVKTSDAAIAALCTDGPGFLGCHTKYDQGKDMTRDERRAFGYEMVARTLIKLIETGAVAVDAKRFREGRGL